GAKSSIHVYKGDLTTQRTDVIAVCSSSEYLFKAICEAGEGSIKTSFDLQSKKNPYYSIIAVKAEGQLKSKKVYFLPWKTNSDPSLLRQSIEKFVSDAIERAVMEKYKSIAFPAIGCGQFGCPIRLVAEAMVQEAYRKLQKSSISVSFIIETKRTDVYDEFQKQLDTLKASLPLQLSPSSSPQNSVIRSRQGRCSPARKHSSSVQQQSRSSSSQDRSLSPPQRPRFLVKENSFSAPRRPRSLLRQRSSSSSRDRSLSPPQGPRFLVKENSFSAPRRPRSSLRQRSSSSSRDRSLSPQGSRPVVRENSFSAPRRPRSSLRQRSPSSPRGRSLSPPQGPRFLVKENSFSAQRRPRSSSRQRWPSLTRDGSLSPQGPRLLAQEHPFSAQRPRFAAQIPSLATSPGGSKKVIAATVNKGTI
ncbi:unnamed protein product, partial [Rotaria sp. Silwood1]